MIEIDGKIVSTDLLTEHFCCDIAACKGQCCIDGDSGAPLDIDEVDILEQEYENYKPYMTPEGIAAVEQQGFMVVDADGDYTTPLVNGCECAYTFVNEQGITLCAIEAAYRAGKCSFKKPISCHLYPIRVVEFSNGTVGLNYHRWVSAARLVRMVSSWVFLSTSRSKSLLSVALVRSSIRLWSAQRIC